VIILNCKIKVKNNKALDKILDRIFSKIYEINNLDKNKSFNKIIID